MISISTFGEELVNIYEFTGNRSMFTVEDICRTFRIRDYSAKRYINILIKLNLVKVYEAMVNSKVYYERVVKK